MKDVTIMCWDELSEEAYVVEEKDGLEMALPDAASDEQAIALTRAALGDGPEERSGWRMDSLARGKNTITIEWRSDRNHLSVTTLVLQ